MFRPNKFSGFIKAMLAVAVLFGSLAFAGGASAHWNDQAVYVLSNSTTDNQVLVFSRTDDGRLLPEDSYSTGGLGTGAGLGSQGALIVDKDGYWLFAVNAASNDISVFATFGSRLFLTDKITSMGVHPISLTLYHDILYVLNAGDMENAANISGFTVSNRGKLAPIAGSTQPLSTAQPGAAQVQFSPDGGLLVVSEKGTNMLDTYTVNGNGVASAPTPRASAGMTPFGFAFDNSRHLIVSEAFGGAPNPSKVSSYRVGWDGTLDVATASLDAQQIAACWVVVSKDGKYAYAANAGSASLSGFSIAADGSLTKLDANGVTVRTAAKPVDMSISYDGQYIYTLTGSNEISAAHINDDGSLSWVRGVGGIPNGAVGIAAR